MSSVRNTLEDHLELCLGKTQAVISHDYRYAIVFKKLRCRDRLVWTVGLTVEMYLYFQIPVVYFTRGFR